MKLTIRTMSSSVFGFGVVAIMAVGLTEVGWARQLIEHADTSSDFESLSQIVVGDLTVIGSSDADGAVVVRASGTNQIQTSREADQFPQAIFPEGRRPAAQSHLRSSKPWLPESGQTGFILNWHNHGGNARKNGLSAAFGPQSNKLIWENDDDFAIIAFQPYVLDNRVFAVRYRDFVGSDAEDEIVAYDLATGAELWCELLPYGGNSQQQWGAHILGVNDGRVYTSRSGNGNSIEAPIRAYDAIDGSFIWESADTTDTGFYGGAVFAPNGDLIVGSFDHLNRFDAIDGSRVWSVPRSCPTSGSCPAILSPDGVFINIPRPGGQTAIAKHDLATGAFQYQSQDLPGLITQNAPFASADGSTIYQAKQHSTNVNFLYAFTDSGSALVEKWNRPIAYSAYHLHGIGPDGSIYTFLSNDEFVRLDPETGDVLNSAGVLLPRGTGPQTAIDANGNVYVSNGWASNPPSDGRLWAFTADLQTNLFTLPLDRQNSGGPALASDGTLVIADRTSVRAYRTESKILLGDVNLDGMVSLLDVSPFVALLTNGGFQAEADINQDRVVDLLDVQPFVGLLGG